MLFEPYRWYRAAHALHKARMPARILRENIDAKDFLYHRRDDPMYKHRSDIDPQ
jgi:hypothetical protein